MRCLSGVHYYSNGDLYDGEWANDRRVGQGYILSKKGIKISTNFVEDKAEGYVEFIDTFGNKFESDNNLDASKSIKD